MKPRYGHRLHSPLAQLTLAALLSACGANLPDAAVEADVAAAPQARVRGVMYKSDSGFVPQNHAVPANAHLTYYGGPVLQNPKPVQVSWGAGVQAALVSGLPGFYQTITSAGYMGWLSEYNTTSPAQSFGAGSFVGSYQITPSITSTSITDAQIQSELTKQINSGVLPPPDANTIYMIDFPTGFSISQGTSSSCVSGGFCAYHGTYSRNTTVGSGTYIFYGVHPDVYAGGCSSGCGTSTAFNNATSVHSHELVEAMTDAAVGVATANAAPLAWYDANNGEIGDICNAIQGTFGGYTLQAEWSNAHASCYLPPTPTGNDFSVAVSPSSGTVSAGGTVAYTVTTAVVSGSAQATTLAVSGLPSGVTGAFSPASITGAGTATLTLTASSSAPSITGAAFTITGTATSGSHTASATVTVNGVAPPAGVTNGGFESGLSGWTTVGTTSAVATSHSGTGAAQVGGTAATNGDSSVSQTFTAPAGATQLSFWYQVHCPDTVTYDWATATLLDKTTSTTTTPLAKTCNNTATWVQVTAAVTAGHSYTLTLTSHDDNYAGDPTYTWFDDVAFTVPAASDFSIAVASPKSVVQGGSVTAAVTTAITSGAAESVAFSVTGLPTGVTAAFSPTSTNSGAGSTLTLTAATTAAVGSYTLTVTGTAATGAHSASLALSVTAPVAGGITNGGFETGSFSGWTTAGTASIVTTGHSGAYGAQLGSTAPTNGDSSASQTFTAPTGSTKVSFWYKVTCPDTVTYDWATATLKDNTAGTAAVTVLAKTCTAAGAWTQVSSALTAGHSYTLTLTSHDDNYAGDATYTQYDDVVIQ
jgi:serine protease